MNKLNNRFIVLGVGILLSVAYSPSHASDEIQDTMSKLSELMAPTPFSTGNLPSKISPTQVPPEAHFIEKKKEQLKNKPQEIISKDIKKGENNAFPIDRNAKNATAVSAPIAEKSAVEIQTETESTEKRVKKAVESTKSQSKKVVNCVLDLFR